MLGIQIDWSPLVVIVAVGAAWLLLLRGALWHSNRRAKSQTSELLKRDGR